MKLDLGVIQKVYTLREGGGGGPKAYKSVLVGGNCEGPSVIFLLLARFILPKDVVEDIVV